MGGYLGVMAKLGPFCSKDNFAGEGGVREIDDPLVRLVSTCMRVGRVAAGWVSLCCEGGHLAGGRYGGLGVAGTLEVVEVVEDLGELLDGTFGWLLKLLEL